ncbi:MAG: metal ABC transporter substrate-binding protein [Lachnospiraceae bacterium]|nr:metal ABC transporter substrate-binding protein [Lachnospiraceae bacterium]MDY5497469.1 metal ABC transporter substrate-binding protein [Anaerobutyricum sp.]
MKTKKIGYVCLCIFLCFFLINGCETVNKNREESTQHIRKKDPVSTGNKKRIVCTTFPQYDWVRQILGENRDQFDVTLLLNNGVDMHSYQPTVRDMAAVGTADLFIYVGGESDTWVKDALKEAKNPDLKDINLMNVLGNSVKEEEIIKGMKESSHGHGHEHEEEEPEYDEHIWLSVKNARTLVSNISKSIQEIDPEHAKIYQSNTKKYETALQNLDRKFEKTIKNGKYKAVVFGDRFPFRYLTDDYHLTYYAAFVGCSAETMAGFETVTYLADRINTLNLPAILIIENSDGRIAHAIKENTGTKNQKILTMDSLQSVTEEKIESGLTYLGVMEKNQKILKQALN